MKKLLVFLCFIPLMLGAQEHVPVSPQDIEAMRDVPTEYGAGDTLILNGDTLTLVGHDVDAFIEELKSAISKQNPVNVMDWAVLLFGVLVSFIGMIKKWWPWFRARLSFMQKSDTPVLVFSFIVAVIWTLVDGQVTAAEVLTKYAFIFTAAVTSYKVLLNKVWKFLAGLFTKRTQAAPPQ